MEADSHTPFPSQPVLSLGVTLPQPPQRPGQGLVERQSGSGVTLRGRVRGQRSADSRLGGIDPVGEVTEPYGGLRPWAGVSKLDAAESSPGRALWDDGPGATEHPSHGRGPGVTGDVSYRSWADGPACLGLHGQGTKGTGRSCAPTPKALRGLR